jgi:ribonuclease BN (tRNA processing enzyme)
MRAFHTSVTDVAAIAQRARAKTLVLYHLLIDGPASEYVGRMKAIYSGPVIIAHTFDIY